MPDVVYAESTWWCWTSATTATSVADPWPGWNATPITASSATNWSSSATWPSWNGQLYVSPPAFTPQPLDERTQLIHANRRRAAAVRGRVAKRRAERLLLEHLDERQQQEWHDGRFFHVETAGGRRRYRINLGLAGNVRLVEDGDRKAANPRGLHGYCMHVYHPDGPVPDEDNVLAQKLLLEADEAEFLRLANVC